MSTQLERDLADEMEKLEPDERAQVLHYMRSLRNDGVPGASLLKYSGRIPEETSTSAPVSDRCWLAGRGPFWVW